MLCSQRYLHFFKDFSFFDLPISLATNHILPIFFSKNDCEIEPVVLPTINPMNSTKWVTTFSWIFHFVLIYFSQKIFGFFSLKNYRCLWVCGTMYKVKKEENLFLGELWLPSQNARTRVRLLYLKLIQAWHSSATAWKIILFKISIEMLAHLETVS